MDLDDEELKATRILNGADKKDREYKIKQLEIHIDHLDDEQWNNWQEVLKYINELNENNIIIRKFFAKQKKEEALEKVKYYENEYRNAKEEFYKNSFQRQIIIWRTTFEIWRSLLDE